MNLVTSVCQSSLVFYSPQHSFIYWCIAYFSYNMWEGINHPWSSSNKIVVLAFCVRRCGQSISVHISGSSLQLRLHLSLSPWLLPLYSKLWWVLRPNSDAFLRDIIDLFLWSEGSKRETNYEDQVVKMGWIDKLTPPPPLFVAWLELNYL